MNAHFVIFDFEFTTWEGARERDWSGENEYREIVQIGAIKVARGTWAVLEELNILIKPEPNPQLSDFFQMLTTISQQDIDQDGLSFDQAFDRFTAFCEDALLFSFGNDMVVFGENIGLHGCKHNVFNDRGLGFVNIAPYIYRIDPTTRGCNSGRLWQHFRLPRPDGAGEHNGLFDCYSILAAMKHLSAQGHQLPI